MGISGNIGEWSEPYVIFKLLADGRLYQADSSMLPSKSEFAHVLNVIRGDTQAEVKNESVQFKFTDKSGLNHTLETNKVMMEKIANRLLSKLKNVKAQSGSFFLPDIEKDLIFYGFAQLKNPSIDKRRTTKRDLGIRLDSPNMGVATLGFSVKSELGAPPTLLNASEATNVVYRVSGLTEAQANTINAINSSNKIMERCAAIKKYSASIQYVRYNNKTFEENLEVVDSALPRILADLIKVHYFEQILSPKVGKLGHRLSNAVELLSKTEPYISKPRKNFCEIKIKRFLRDCALGLMPSKEWNGVEDATGGYIVVLPDGQLVALYVYNNNVFEKYLYESTIFERASTTRHNYMHLVKDPSSNDYFLKLNLQIRFTR
jgi:type II restriction enzyme